MLKKISYILLTICFLFITTVIYAEETAKKGLAVLDFKPSGVSASEATFVTDFFRNALVSAKTFRLIDKSNMDKILSEQGFQQTGCTTQECAVQMGKLLNVKAMISGNFGLLFGEYVITINLVDVETGEITYSDSGRCKDPTQLESVTMQMAARLTSNETGEAVPPKPAAAPVTPPAPVYQAPVEEPVSPPAYAPPRTTPSIVPQALAPGTIGKVVKIQGAQVTVNVGSLNGYKKNAIFEILAVVEQIKSPITGQIIKTKTKPIAKIKLTYLEPQASIGTLISLKAGFKVTEGLAIALPIVSYIKYHQESTNFAGTNLSNGKYVDRQSLDSYTDIDWKFSKYKFSFGTIDMQRLFSVIGTAGYLQAAYDTEYFSVGIGPSNYGGSSSISASLRLGSPNKAGVCLSGKMISGDSESSYFDKDGTYMHNNFMNAVASLDFIFAPAFKMFIKNNTCSAKRYYGGRNQGGTAQLDTNLNLSLYSFSSEELRSAVTAGLVLRLFPGFTINAGMGVSIYDGTLTFEYDDPLTVTVLSVDEPHGFMTVIGPVLGVMINISDRIGFGAEFEGESTANTGQSGSSTIMPSIRTKLEIKL